jgi:hypothetical protein
MEDSGKVSTSLVRGMSKLGEVEAHADSPFAATKATAPPMQTSFGATFFKTSPARGAIDRREHNQRAIFTLSTITSKLSRVQPATANAPRNGME